MRLMLFLAVFFLVSSFFQGFPIQAVAIETSLGKQDVVIKWALVASRLSERHEKFFPITKDTTLKSGDRFKIMVEAESDCFVYVLFRTSDGEILNLLPGVASSEVSGSFPMTKTYLPGFHDWFTLDSNVGLEKVYLLASESRLKKLELLLEEYEAVSEDQRDSVASTIISTIKDIRRKNKRFKANVARPLQIGGMFRGITKSEGHPQDISSFAVKIQSEKFFAKTFTIEHK